MKHYGDITKLSGYELPPVDILTGGSPCQDLSVAGKRAGLAGERSGLFMEQIRLVKEMRNHARRTGRTDDMVRYMVWENVPGAFSSNGGEDFRAVLEETAKVAQGDAVIPRPENGKWPSAGCIVADGWSIAWRVHDAQFHGVPQRRKRICLIADFDGDTAGKILFELRREATDGDTEQTFYDPREEPGREVQSVAESMSGNFESSPKTREKTAGAVADGSGGTSGAIGFNRERCGAVAMEERMPTLQAAAGESGNNKPMVMQMAPKAVSFQERAGKPGGGKGILIQDERTGALSTLNNQSVCVFEPGAASRLGGYCWEDKAGTLRANAGDNQQAVVYGTSDQDLICIQGNIAGGGGSKQLGDGWRKPPMYTLTCADTHGVCVIEGNGSRPSHQGDGFKESETMYTLNSTEHHAVAYRKTSHPKSAEDGQGWEEACTNDTLNAFDNGESRTPTVIVGFDSYNLQSTGDIGRTLTTPSGGLNEHMPVLLENRPQDSRVKIREDGIVQTLDARMGMGGGNVPLVMEEQILLESSQNHATVQTSGISTTLPAAMGEGGGYVPMVTYPKTTGALMASGYDKLGTQEAANDMYVVSENWDGTQIAPTLTKNNAGGNQRMPDKDNFNAVVQSMEVFHCTSEEEKTQTLKARDYKDPQVVSYGLDRSSYNQGKNAKFDFSVEKEKIGSQVARGPGAVCAVDFRSGVESTINGTLQSSSSHNVNSNNACRVNLVVRRLTPLECERLQGFPDHWTDIGEWTDSKGKKHKDADSPRYKALGNSIAIPFWEWMARRMVKYLGKENPKMASLFDGIGGFPLAYSRCGCEPVWASEIEEFPIAVTKIRFPEQ